MRSVRALSKQKLVWLFLSLFIFPIPRVQITDWHVHVIDQHGLPVSGIRVSRHWNNYTFGLSGGADSYTDKQGSVIFRKDVRIRPTIYWVLRAAWNVVNLGVHASFGKIGEIGVSDPDRDWELDVASARPGAATCVDTNCTMATLHSELRIKVN